MIAVVKQETTKQDPRVTRTQRALAEALISLTIEHGYEEITIRDITERASVGYATFFRHYADKDSLLRVVLEVVLDEILDLTHPTDGVDDPVQLGVRLFRFVASHEAICRVLLNGPGAAMLMQRMIERGTQAAMENPDEPWAQGLPRDVAVHHLVSGSIELLRWWLERGRPYPPEQMAQIYLTVIVRPARGV
jgi:AcrR family transcriptional regulator